MNVFFQTPKLVFPVSLRQLAFEYRKYGINWWLWRRLIKFRLFLFITDSNHFFYHRRLAEQFRFCMDFLTEPENEAERKKPQKRSSNPTRHAALIQKQLVQSGKAHFTASNRLIEEKVFNAQITCPCKFKCHEKIDVVKQKEIFNHYYNDLSNWSAKTKYLRSLVERKPTKENLLPRINVKKKRFLVRILFNRWFGEKATSVLIRTMCECVCTK